MGGLGGRMNRARALWLCLLGVTLLGGLTIADIARARGSTPVGTPTTRIGAARAEQIARRTMPHVIGLAPAARAQIEVREGTGGWMVIFHDAWATCAEGRWWPGACRVLSSEDRIRDVYACVDWQGTINGYGYYFQRIGPEFGASCGGPAVPMAAPAGPPGVTPVSDPSVP